MSQNIHHAHKSSAKVVFEKAVLVGLIHGYQTEDKLKEYLDELAFLAQTAGAEVVKIFTQKLVIIVLLHQTQQL